MGRTCVAIERDLFCINGRPTYEGRSGVGSSVDPRVDSGVDWGVDVWNGA